MDRFDVGYAVTRAGLRALGYTSRRVRTAHGGVHLLSARGRGTLPTVVLLHGLGSSALDYFPLLHRLRAHVRRVVAPDQLGHGHSGEPSQYEDQRALWESQSDALVGALDEPAIVFGNSFGGLAALRFALAHPALVRGLYLASPAGAPSTAGELAALREALTLDSHGAALEFVDRMFHPRPALAHAIAWSMRRRMAAPTPRALLENLQEDALVSPDELASIDVPVRVFWGRRERLLPASHLDFFRTHLPPHAEIHEPEGFGHGPQLDDAGAVVRDLVAFARRVETLRAREAGPR